jgi:hypothetical protein
MGWQEVRVRWPEAVASPRLPAELGVRRFDSPSSSVEGSLSRRPVGKGDDAVACRFALVAMVMERLQVGML